MACLLQPRVQLPTQVLQMSASSRSGRHGGKNYFYAGNAYLSKG